MRQAAKVRHHEFTVVLVTDPDEDEADALYGVFNDGTISTTGGIARIDFHREAGSLEEAIRSAIADVRSVGFEVARVEIEPNATIMHA